jgi:hypothetical protein
MVGLSLIRRQSVGLITVYQIGGKFMARKFMVYDVISFPGIDHAYVSHVGKDFLKTDRGWLMIDQAVLIRPANLIYKDQFESGHLIICDKPTKEDQLALLNTYDAISNMMEK